MKYASLWIIVLATPLALAASPDDKRELFESINRRDAEAWEAALKIWQWAEVGYQEERSSALLASMLEKAGLDVERGVAGMPTAFVATCGSGRPVIGILGEFDALPGLSQDLVPRRKPLPGSKNGHACGHHLFGTASASAAIAVAEQIRAGTIRGTVRYYGCPAEEGGSAKAFMVRGGLFDDCDVVLHWHPSDKNSAGDRGSLARMAVKFRFHGRSSHAAAHPDLGRSALDAAELTNHAAQLLREHTPEDTRIHHVITYGGGAPNVVPEFAEVYYYVRHPQASVVRALYDRLLLCAKGGALATETELEVRYEGGIHPIRANGVLAQLTMKNLRELNDLEYDTEELAFAIRIQQTLVNPPPMDEIQIVIDRSGTIGMGSTDVGDISQIVPTTGFTTVCWVPGTPGHSWQAVACGGHSIGRKGMNLAARVLAATAWDLYKEPGTLAAARAVHEERTSGREYESLLEANQKPPLDYRDPPQK